MNPEYSITQSSTMTHPYKWATVDVLSKKNIYFVQWTLVIMNSEEATGFYLIF